MADGWELYEGGSGKTSSSSAKQFKRVMRPVVWHIEKGLLEFIDELDGAL